MIICLIVITGVGRVCVVGFFFKVATLLLQKSSTLVARFQIG